MLCFCESWGLEFLDQFFVALRLVVAFRTGCSIITLRSFILLNVNIPDACLVGVLLNGGEVDSWFGEIPWLRYEMMKRERQRAEGERVKKDHLVFFVECT